MRREPGQMEATLLARTSFKSERLKNLKQVVVDGSQYYVFEELAAKLI